MIINNPLKIDLKIKQHDIEYYFNNKNCYKLYFSIKIEGIKDPGIIFLKKIIKQNSSLYNFLIDSIKISESIHGNIRNECVFIKQSANNYALSFYFKDDIYSITDKKEYRRILEEAFENIS